jgi:hypothetical protein
MPESPIDFITQRIWTLIDELNTNWIWLSLAIGVGASPNPILTRSLNIVARLIFGAGLYLAWRMTVAINF